MSNETEGAGNGAAVVERKDVKWRTARQRDGEGARVPKEVRQQVNEMLDDGFPYSKIIRELGEHGQGMEVDSIRRWRKGGYLEYLREQRLLEQCRERTNRVLELMQQEHRINGFQAAQQVAT